MPLACLAPFGDLPSVLKAGQSKEGDPVESFQLTLIALML
jgi:hypothetical protein